ncbi:MAG: SusC/RagA family TonB-linked outer membrane protein [Mediterranea sp.]|jgi:TonB-linked SusC/RagA family outer membrane protein|nr:SusC/RagA family TonB-linked outer membrane protein [Mediterranea sp.]
MKKTVAFFLAALFMSISQIMAQQPSVVQGVVTSADDGLPIVGASVLVTGTTVGTITDVDGKFTIRDVPSSAKTLRVSYIGMQTREVAIVANVTVVLQSDAATLDEVVVTAMGIPRKEKSLGYSATTVKSDEISVARNTNAMSSLSGKVAGLQVQTTSTDPGAANLVTIRGFGSINGSNQPLYVVDGVSMQNNSLITQGHTITLNGIANIAPDDIETVTVLKGAAATALYGSRAANGVILITTKKGTKGETRNFTIEYNGGVQARQVSLLPDMQNEFGQGWNGGQTYIENGSWGPRFDGSTQVYGPIWNNQQLIHEYSAKKNNVRDFFETGISWNNSVALSGVSSDEKMTYYLSYANASDNGIIPSDADSYTRNTISYRGDYEATKWLKVSSSINFAKTSTDLVGSFQGTSVVDGVYEMPRDINIPDMQDLSNPFYTPEAYLTPYGITNPYWAIANNYHHTDTKQIYGKVQVDIKPIQDLTVSYRFGFDYSDYDVKIGQPEIALDDALINNDYGYAPSNMNQAGYVYSRYYRTYETNHDVLATYNKNFENKISVTATGGLNINERGNTYMYGQADQLAIQSGFWDLSNGASWTSLTEDQMKRRLIGLFGDATIGYNDMIYLGLTARNDWSSTLPMGNNSFFYPGATLSWIFTRLLPENEALTFGKLRFAYGKTGNDANAYLTSARYVQGYADGYYASSIAQFPMNGANTFVQSTSAPSNTLRPEMTTEFEAGLNLQFFHGRLGLDMAYYHRTTNDQIFTLPVEPATGYGSMVTNFGKVRNSGIEILINSTPVKTRNLRWDLGVNFSVNRSKVVSLPESLEGGRSYIYGFSAGNDAVYMYAEKGKPLGTFWTYMPQFVTDPANPHYGSPIVDSHGQPVLSQELQETGYDMNHKWTGGLTTSLTAYGFTLSAALDVRYGGHMFSRTKNLMQFTGNGVVTLYNDRRPFIIPNSVVVTSTDEDGNPTAFAPNNSPILSADGTYQDYFNLYGYGYGGAAYLLDKTFVKVRNITLAWELPKKWISRLSLSNVSVSAFVNNPFIWTKSDNYYVDPEASTTPGTTDLTAAFGEMYSNPSSRVFGCNLSVKF